MARGNEHGDGSGAIRASGWRSRLSPAWACQGRAGARSSVRRVGGPRQGAQRYRKALERSSAVSARVRLLRWGFVG